MDQWYFQAFGKEFGPFSAAELKRMAGEGWIKAATPVRKGTGGQWLPATRVSGLLRPGTGGRPNLGPRHGGVPAATRWTIALGAAGATVLGLGGVIVGIILLAGIPRGTSSPPVVSNTPPPTIRPEPVPLPLNKPPEPDPVPVPEKVPQARDPRPPLGNENRPPAPAQLVAIVQVWRALVANQKELGLHDENIKMGTFIDRIREYCARMQQLDMSGCPAQFRVAVNQHTRAWENWKAHLEVEFGIAGFGIRDPSITKRFFSQLQVNAPGDDPSRKLEAEVNRTLDELEKISAKYADGEQ